MPLRATKFSNLHYSVGPKELHAARSDSSAVEGSTRTYATGVRIRSGGSFKGEMISPGHSCVAGDGESSVDVHSKCDTNGLSGGETSVVRGKAMRAPCVLATVIVSFKLVNAKPGSRFTLLLPRQSMLFGWLPRI